MPFSLATPALFSRLEAAKSVLLCGAGGGFDVYASLPLALALHRAGKRVHFANLTFTSLGGTNAPYVAEHVACVSPDVTGEAKYFPERSLARWLGANGLEPTVYALEKVGVRPMKAAYAALVRRLAPDALVLVDGGTDLLMFGDEAGLGTPEEDMTSLAAARSVEVPTKLAACLGFGIDSHHGVCHAHFLENVATLERDGGYLGAFSVPRQSPEGEGFLDAVADARAENFNRQSLVNGSIAAAVRGDFGDAQFSERTKGSELFINPLMGLYFTFELEAVARRSLYLPMLDKTETIFEVSAAIEAFRHDIATRPRRAIPH